MNNLGLPTNYHLDRHVFENTIIYKNGGTDCTCTPWVKPTSGVTDIPLFYVPANAHVRSLQVSAPLLGAGSKYTFSIKRQDGLNNLVISDDFFDATVATAALVKKEVLAINPALADSSVAQLTNFRYYSLRSIMSFIKQNKISAVKDPTAFFSPNPENYIISVKATGTIPDDFAIFAFLEYGGY